MIKIHDVSRLKHAGDETTAYQKSHGDNDYGNILGREGNSSLKKSFFTRYGINGLFWFIHVNHNSQGNAVQLI